VWVLAIGLMDFSLEQAIVVPALPAMQAHYGVSASSVAWVLTGFLLASAVTTPIAGRLGDRLGKRRVLLWSLALFVAGSVICALGTSIAVVIAGRIVQGLGAGIGPLAVALVRDHLPREKVARAVGVLVGLAGAGGVVGFLACGLLVKYVSVQSIFWFLAAVSALCLAAVALTVKESPRHRGAAMDWLGALLLGSAFTLLLYAITYGNDWHWESGRELGLLGTSATLLAAFWWRERTAAEPLLDPGALASRPIASANLAVFAVGYALLVAYTLIPFVAGLPKSTGYGLGLSTLELSLVLAPSAAGALVGGLASGQLVSAFGARRTVAGAVALGVLSYVGFVVLPITTVVIVLLMIPVGFATGLAIGALSDLVVLTAPSDETGVNMALMSVIRAVGSALGSQVAVAILTAPRGPLPGVPARSGFSDAFVMAMIATGVALAAVTLIPRRHADPAAVGLGAGAGVATQGRARADVSDARAERVR
jgi:MFS family permease